ncbi:MAG TPA: aquaporin [Gemmatimonadales bacterium]|nr:aquaporin [Gemmatimonadales bacterium]
MRQTLRPLIAEFIGVFMLVFIGGGAIILDAYRGGIGLGGIAAAHGLALAIAVTATMSISGGHINPAITVGLWSVGRIDARKAGLYVVAQLLGAIAAALALKLMFPTGAATVKQLGALSLGADTTLLGGILIEAVLTFFLAFAVMGTAVDPSAPKVGGFGIGLTLWMCVLAGGHLTGAALNPARAFGPALVAGAWIGQVAYWVGPILGSVVAMQIYERFLLKRDGA